MPRLHRISCSLTVVALALLSVASSAVAAPAIGVQTVEGEVSNVVFSGDAMIVARQPYGRRLVVERRVPGQAPTVLFRGSKRDGEFPDAIRLAASAEAVAISLGGEEPPVSSRASRVLIGPADGPLRQVARCAAGPALPALAVDGTRVAWADGGCVVNPEAYDGPVELEPASIAIGDVNADVAVRRIPLAPNRLPIALALAQGRGLVNLSRATRRGLSFGEVRRLDGDVLGETLHFPGITAVPVAIDASGNAVLFDNRSEKPRSGRKWNGCPRARTVSATGLVRPLALIRGACLTYSPPVHDGSASVVAAAGRMAEQITHDPRLLADGILTARADGTGRPRVVVRTKTRSPLGVAAAEGVVAWWQDACTGATEIITVADPSSAPAYVPPICRATLVAPTVAVRGGNGVIELRCPAGCYGGVSESTHVTARSVQEFALAPGTGRIRFPLSRRARRRGEVPVVVKVLHGPRFRRTLRLVR